MTAQNILSISSIAAVVAFFAFFRVRKVKKAYLNTTYDHFINGTVLNKGLYVGYLETAEDGIASTTGAQYGGAYPLEDLELKDGWIIERRS